MKCPKHPKYQAKQAPTTDCARCSEIYSHVAKFLAAYKEHGSLIEASKALHWSYWATHQAYTFAHHNGHIEHRPVGAISHEDRKAALAEEDQPAVLGRLKAPATPKAYLAKPGQVNRFIITAAQNNTKLHDKLWENVQALAAHYDAQIIVARMVYNKFSEAGDMDKKLIIDKTANRKSRDYWWDERLAPYFYDKRLELSPGLVFCGETNILPTVKNPLSGYESYTGRPSSIIPHPRIAMRSVCSHPSEGTKLMYTTGTLTQHNYIQRRAGQMAEFHHCYGALLVEVDGDGTWFCRQLNGDSEGVLHDWELRVADGHVSTGNSLEAITWGDIHVAYGDPVSYKLAWGEGGILDQLRPRYQFMHDTIDFRARNGHNIKYGHHLQAFIEHCLGHRVVEKEMQITAKFLAEATRRDTETLVVDSNHDNFLVEWLEKTGNFRTDRSNAVYFLEAAHYLWKETQRLKHTPNMTEWAMRRELDEYEHLARGVIRFLDEGEPFVICKDAHGGIQCDMHGHERFNGARGGPMAFANTGRKGNYGHVHSSGIWDGAYFGGIMGLLQQGYNKGWTSWSQSNIFTYPNGKRAIQTMYDGKARA